ncbi:MAG: hypothetical protein M9890_07075 [Thermomicrobiales bacterium]|nr:hypothetical protein [Thermomicrobiales bacterium]
MTFHPPAWLRTIVVTFALLLALIAPLQSALIARAEEDLPVTTSVAPAPEVNPAIQAAWQQGDGDAALTGQPWLWGEQPLALAVEYQQDSPTGLRSMVYYEKGRLDIPDPSEDQSNPWYVVPASLVREMLTGEIPFGDDVEVKRGRATIPVVGDAAQAQALTYATLAPLASVDTPTTTRSGLGLVEHDSVVPRSATPDAMVTALVDASGVVTLGAVADSIVSIGAFDAVTAHNIAEPFNTWASNQPYPDLYLLGHPLTEPYWLDTTIGGQPERVMIQAFERRVLVYRPNAPEGPRVESTDVGLHYRLWRNLSQPTNPSLVPLASSIPFGEEIVAAATANLIDPHLLAAIELVASNGNPSATLKNGGKGILGLRPEAAMELGVPEKSTAEKLAEEKAKAAATAKSGTVTTKTTSKTTPPVEVVITPEPTATAEPTDTQTQTNTNTAINAVVAGSDGSMTRLQVSDEEITIKTVMSDPGLNAAYAARDVARWNPQSLNFADIVADYYSGGQPDDNDPAQQVFVEKVVQMRDTLLAQYPSAPVTPAPGSEVGQLLGAGHSAYYSPSYDRAWWERTLRLYESWNLIAPGWQDDPNGYYCVRPGYIPGYKLRLSANGVTIDCTVGDMVADPHLGSWLAHWVIEMNWEAFTALGLDRNNSVEVYHLGSDPVPAVPPVPPVEPTPDVTDEVVEPTPTPEPTEPAVTPTPEPTAPVEATPTPLPTTEPTVEPSPTTEPTVEPTTEPTVEPTPIPSPEPTEPAEPTATPEPTEPTTPTYQTVDDVVAAVIAKDPAYAEVPADEMNALVSEALKRHIAIANLPAEEIAALTDGDYKTLVDTTFAGLTNEQIATKITEHVATLTQDDITAIVTFVEQLRPAPATARPLSASPTPIP